MNKLLALLLASLFSTVSFAAAHTGAPMTTAPATSAANPKPMEAMKAGDPKAQAAAQAKVDAKTSMGDSKAVQPEAMKSGSEKPKAAAEAKKDKKVVKAKRSTEEQMKKDAAKL